MTGVLSVVAALILLSVLVMFHELGHFLVGKKLGFGILEFSIGMGPTLLKKEKNGIVYSIRALPIGGMCRFLGEDTAPGDKRSFNAFPLWKRFLTVAAGPVVNLILAVVLSVLMMACYGGYMPRIVEIPNETSPAAVCGLEIGDILLSVDGTEIPSYEDTVSGLRAAPAEGFELTVLRNGEVHSVRITDAYDAEAGYNLLGITISPERVRYPLLKSLRLGVEYVGTAIGSIFTFLGTLFRGKVNSTDVSGTVGTVAVISQAMRYGMEVVLNISVLINVSLGMMNLLPIPALDGGRLFFMLIEAVRGKPIDPDKEGLIHAIGLLLLFALMIFLTFNDIKNLIF